MTEEQEPKEEYNDYPFLDIAAACEDLISKGATIYQKFTCANCGQRLGIDIPNVLYASGQCDQCGHITDIAKTGCNYMAIF